MIAEIFRQPTFALVYSRKPMTILHKLINMPAFEVRNADGTNLALVYKNDSG